MRAKGLLLGMGICVLCTILLVPFSQVTAQINWKVQSAFAPGS